MTQRPTADDVRDLVHSFHMWNYADRMRDGYAILVQPGDAGRFITQLKKLPDNYCQNIKQRDVYVKMVVSWGTCDGRPCTYHYICSEPKDIYSYSLKLRGYGDSGAKCYIGYGIDFSENNFAKVLRMDYDRDKYSGMVKLTEVWLDNQYPLRTVDTYEDMDRKKHPKYSKKRDLEVNLADYTLF